MGRTQHPTLNRWVQCDTARHRAPPAKRMICEWIENCTGMRLAVRAKPVHVANDGSLMHIMKFAMAAITIEELWTKRFGSKCEAYGPIKRRRRFPNRSDFLRADCLLSGSFLLND